MESKYIAIQYYKSPFGELILGDFEHQLVLCNWLYRKKSKGIDERIQKGLNAEYLEKRTPTLESVGQQLEEYFSGRRQSFDVDILTVGSEFQRKVWKALLAIPYGKTASYLELSKSIGNVAAIRAVAAANGANAISILIPCHRIIGSDGNLVGYGGGLDVKKKLLQLEGASLNPNQLELF